MGFVEYLALSWVCHLFLLSNPLGYLRHTPIRMTQKWCVSRLWRNFKRGIRQMSRQIFPHTWRRYRVFTAV